MAAPMASGSTLAGPASWCQKGTWTRRGDDAPGTSAPRVVRGRKEMIMKFRIAASPHPAEGDVMGRTW